MSALAPEKHAWLEHIELATGQHPGPNGVACVMEAVSYIAGEPWSDHPECASKVITGFLIRWNDAMNDADRQILKPLIPRLVGTKASVKVEEKRAWMLTDWLARECAPAWSRLAGLTAQAELLEGLSPLTSAATARKAQPRLETARTDARAAWDAARDAAWAAAGLPRGMPRGMPRSCRVGCRVGCRGSCRVGCRGSCRVGCREGCRGSCRVGCREGCRVGCPRPDR